jgi:Flp pilus assembly protein TadD
MLPLALGACSNGWQDVTDLFAPTVEPSRTEPVKSKPAPQRKSTLDRDLAMAQRLSAGSDRQAALQAWIGLRTLYPSNATVATGLGEAYLALDQPREALSHFEAVLDDDPDHGGALSGTGRALVKIDQPVRALSVLDRAVAAQPWDVRVWNARGVALDMQNRHPEAQTSYLTGLGMEPRNGNLLNNLGLSLALSGRVDEAISLLEPVAAGGAYPRARQTLSLVYGLKGEDAKAAEAASRDLDAASVDQNMRVFRLLRRDDES